MPATRLAPLRRLGRMMLAVGPGIFCIGYTIGTGSVTTMATSGSRFGMELLWDLVLSCLFAWVLMEAYGRFALVTGQTAIHAFRTRLPGGPLLAMLTLVGVVMGQWCCLSGLVGLSSAALYEGLRLFVPALPAESYYAVLLIATALMTVMYGLLWIGRYSFFEKVLVVFVTLMGVSFLASASIALPSPGEIAAGLVPSIPRDAEGQGMYLLVAALVGTTMAAPTFVVRPLLLAGKGWTRANLRDQARDSFVAALLMFVISGAIMACATAALFHRGVAIEKVLDMVHTLGPVAGKYAVAIFLVGTVSAGLSSIFPIAMVAPLLVADFRAGVFDTRSKQFRTLTAVACLIGMTVPVFGSNPIAAQIATQVAQVFVLPLVVGGILVLVNRGDLMGEHKAGPLLNAGLVAALAFSLVMSYIAVRGLAGKFEPSVADAAPSAQVAVPAIAGEEPAHTRSRQQMIERDLTGQGREITDRRVLEAMARVPRHRFVPADLAFVAYDDRPLPIGHQQTISQPYIVALMTQLAQPKPESKALDIGTGSGYQAAVLAELCREVYSIEIIEPLADEARQRLVELDYDNVTVRHGDGYRGWKEHAPFEVIIVAAAPDHVPQPLVDQLAPGGRLVIPVGDWYQELLLIEKTQDGTVRRRSITGVAFVPMTGEARKE